jgi:GNAT superfamily N-acetyltransferase
VNGVSAADAAGETQRGGIVVRRLDAPSDAQLQQLADVLVDCVAGGASVSFMHPLAPERALAFWRGVAAGVARGERVLLVAEDGDAGGGAGGDPGGEADGNGAGARICGTVQLVVDQPDNQPHRADVSKMLVHRRARRRGVGAALMQAVEAEARAAGKTLLVLDTITGSDAARLYTRLGWQHTGDIPDFALMPHGGLAPTSIYWRRVPPA